MDNKKDIGKAFKEKLDGLQKSPGDALWNSINASLAEKKPVAKNPIWQKTRFFVAGAAIIFGFIAYFLWPGHNTVPAPSHTPALPAIDSTEGMVDTQNAKPEDNPATPGDTQNNSPNIITGNAKTDTNANNNNNNNSNNNNSNNNFKINNPGQTNTGSSALSARPASPEKDNEPAEKNTNSANNGYKSGSRRAVAGINTVQTASRNRANDSGFAEPGSNTANTEKNTASEINGTPESRGADAGISTPATVAGPANEKDSDINAQNPVAGAAGNTIVASDGEPSRSAKPEGTQAGDKRNREAGSTGSGHETGNTATLANNKAIAPNNPATGNNPAPGSAAGNEPVAGNTSASGNTILNEDQAGVVSSGNILRDSTAVTAPKADSVAVAAITPKDSLAAQQKREADLTHGQSRGFYFFAHLSPTVYGSVPKAEALIGPEAKGTTKSNVALNFGVHTGYNFNSKWGLRTGAVLKKMEFTTSHLLERNPVLYVPVAYGESSTPPADFGNINYRQGVNNAVVISMLGAPATHYAKVDLINKFSFIEIPLEATYAMSGNRLGTYLSGGISTLFATQNDVFAGNSRGNVLLGSSKEVKDLSFSANLGAGFYYKFLPGLQLNLEPAFKYHIGTFGNNNPFSFTIQAGLQYNFDLGKNAEKE